MAWNVSFAYCAQKWHILNMSLFTNVFLCVYENAYEYAFTHTKIFRAIVKLLSGKQMNHNIINGFIHGYAQVKFFGKISTNHIDSFISQENIVWSDILLAECYLFNTHVDKKNQFAIENPLRKKAWISAFTLSS